MQTGRSGLTGLAESWARTDDGVRLWTARSGTGAVPVVLCHGGPGGWDQMEPVAAMLDDVATVVRWDQRGCGRSGGGGPYTYDRFVADLESVRHHHGFGRIVVGGHSGGSSLALFWAVAHADACRGVLFLCGTGLRWHELHRDTYRSERLARLGDDLRRYEELRALPARSPAEDRELLLLNESTNHVAPHRAAAMALAEAWLDERFDANVECNVVLGRELQERCDAVAPRLGVLDVPVLVVHGAGDPRPVACAEEVAAALPDARLAVIDGAGHVPWVERPDELRGVLRTFLAEVASSA